MVPTYGDAAHASNKSVCAGTDQMPVQDRTLIQLLQIVEFAQVLVLSAARASDYGIAFAAVFVARGTIASSGNETVKGVLLCNYPSKSVFGTWSARRHLRQ